MHVPPQRLGLLLPALALTVPLLAAHPTTAQARTPSACAAYVVTDFDGDSATDAVVADPDATVSGRTKAGRVVVLYGGNGTFEVGEGGGRAVITQNTSGVGGTAEAGDQFGSALTTADLDCDGYTDLIVGTPYEDLGSTKDTGLTQVIWGSPAGLGAERPSTDYDQTDFGGARHRGDHFGAALASIQGADFDGTDAPAAYALGIGVPGWDVGSATDAGAAAFITPLDGGSVFNLVTQDSPNMPGVAEKGDHFGAALAMSGEYDYDRTKTVVGAPGEDTGSAKDTGVATLIYQFDENGPGKAATLDQNTAGALGKPEAGDRFGAAVATVTDSIDRTRIAIGAPGEDIGSVKDAGAVQLFSEFDDDLKSGPVIVQGQAGVSGAAEAGDRFGEVLAAGGLYDEHPTLIVGVPHEDGAAKDVGIVQIFDVVSPGTGDRKFSQDSAGVPGVAKAGDRFGATVTAMTGEESVTVIGVPDDTDHASGMVDLIPDPGQGSPRAWVPGSDGIPAAGAKRFGGGLALATD